MAVAYTDAAGAYAFEGVSPGLQYSVKIDSPDPGAYNDVVYLLPPVS